ncbi:MAG: hypothetical protein IPF62_14270 [Bacteroidetes bacterium]|nr:hypothetical protein [Bacteroidota bacterium]
MGGAFLTSTSNICDSATGKLLFMCNGARIWDTLGNIMENGDSLMPTKLYTLNTPPIGGRHQLRIQQQSIIF